MSLPAVKKGSSSGRVRMAYSFPQSTLVNYYVGGAGVGAVSTANRRALRRRAEWRPTEDGKESKKCFGYCQPNRYANNKEFTMQNEGTALAVYPTQPSSRVLVSTYFQPPFPLTSVMSVLGIPIPVTPYSPTVSANSFTEVASFTSGAPLSLTFTLNQPLTLGIGRILLGSGQTAPTLTIVGANNQPSGTTWSISGVGGVVAASTTIDYGGPNVGLSPHMKSVGAGITISITNPPEGDIYISFFGKS
jgi:hypothetical protein